MIDYPGVPVDHALVEERHGILRDVRVPIRPHFGVMALAPKEARVRRFGPALLFRRQRRRLADRSASGRLVGGKPFSRAALYLILQNRILSRIRIAGNKAASSRSLTSAAG